ncbi:DegV family protein [Salinisphaera sp. P385]|uniref:DegV family protein n=1 Tax=Spectribacter acetivorans TaxID=3075603 RepID=A0ABU3B3F2_9GAMM|nr:DegV family protein [Salinisphaera sp. P385]MDT0616988.1 DegV family protein [Salinisphaera sp. P385]
MRIGLVVDSGCDLPRSFIDEHNILVLPISIRIGDELFVDERDPDRTTEFYRRQALDKSQDAETVPFSMEQIRDLFLNKVVTNYDYALVQTIAQSRSPIFQNATDASHAILRAYKPVRKAAGVEGPFALRVIDSQSLFAGQAALAVETVRLIESGVKVNELRQRVEELATKAHGFGTFPDLYYVRERARKKGDNSISWLGAFMGSALDIKPILCGRHDQTFPVAKVRHFDAAVARIFDYTVKRIERGLLAPTVCVSYAGDAEAIKQMPGYDRFVQAARAHDVQVMTSMMATTGGVNLGPGALVVGFLAEPEEFE